jgi:hypothetical protein
MHAFHVADEPPIAVSELVRLISRELEMRPRILAVPYPIVSMTSRALGREDDVARLFEPMVVDSTKARTILNWSSRTSLTEGLRRTVAASPGRHPRPSRGRKWLRAVGFLQMRYAPRLPDLRPRGHSADHPRDDHSQV